MSPSYSGCSFSEWIRKRFGVTVLYNEVNSLWWDDRHSNWMLLKYRPGAITTLSRFKHCLFVCCVCVCVVCVFVCWRKVSRTLCLTGLDFRTANLIQGHVKTYKRKIMYLSLSMPVDRNIVFYFVINGAEYISLTYVFRNLFVFRDRPLCVFH